MPTPSADGAHGYKDGRLWDAIREYAAIEVDPIGKANEEDGRPIGHTTHNVFVKCKKTKQMFLITARQASKIDLKQVASAVGAKELRLCKEVEETLGSTKGCLTCLALFYDERNAVQWVVEEELLQLPEWCICAGCADPLDHAQHNVTTLKTTDVAKVIPGHYAAKAVVNGMGSTVSLVSKGEPSGAATAATAAGKPKAQPEKPKPAVVENAAAESKKASEKKVEKKPQKFADDHLFTRKPVSETLFAIAFSRYDEQKREMAIKGA
mmetsp:Transcript_3193/g.7521  ORF Transcript_3193/g.7521 Transcript_3193/m.7521 type:complete len:266 (+) Transcript_3193:201-998(+)